MDRQAWNRRQLLKALWLGSCGTATLPAWVEALGDMALGRIADGPSGQATAPRWTPSVLTAHEAETVDILSELIIPQTDTAGARRAGVARFIDAVLADAPTREREPFVRGLAWVDARSEQLFRTTLWQATPQQQTTLLADISDPAAASADRTGVEFFQALKTLTITGYYTSQIGMLEELGGDGRRMFADYGGCVHPGHKGDPAVRPGR